MAKITDKPTMAVQTANSDDSEVTNFLPKFELSNEYLIPQFAQSITIATIEGESVKYEI